MEKMASWTTIKDPLPKLSLGIELEFALATHTSGWPDPDPDRRQVYWITQREDSAPGQGKAVDRARNAQDNISKTFTEASICALRESDVGDEPYEQYLDQWVVNQDSSVKGPSEDKFRYSFQPIEVQLPACLMTEGSLNEVQGVI
jgi:hypothetical protein